MIDASAAELTLEIGNKDIVVKQSPGLLTSNRPKGTTGAAVWRTTQLLAAWLDANDNILFKTGLLSISSTVLELGAGVAGVIPLVLADKVGRYVATDQEYACKLLHENLRLNHDTISARRKQSSGSKPALANIQVESLDWETDDVAHLFSSLGLTEGIDWIIASDCIYNFHLIEPLVETCVEACRLGRGHQQRYCLIAQQLRQPDVFESWLNTFHKRFRTWRLADDVLRPSLGSTCGFVVHVGILR